jgi:hypothetical protein
MIDPFHFAEMERIAKEFKELSALAYYNRGLFGCKAFQVPYLLDPDPTNCREC